ncbi:uncharacterized protein LOC127701903 [Mytilus californianus]|uniref:uncharacterized protein LOC127701903 n=1 Tax=Mytilus californianus TaxID=6549 RepID=UPI002245D8A3|nr:uncharacterized protein LOC127701903 [Mytilus californianus]
MEMDNFIFILWLCVCSAAASGHFSFYKMEKTEKLEVREFEMDRNPFTSFGKRKIVQQRGNITNCGDKKYKVSIQWEPKILNTQGVATVYWDLVAPFDFDSGNAELDAWLPGVPDTPILNIDQKGTCGDLKKLIPSIICPIKKNDELNSQFTFRDLRRLPTGKFDIELKLTNDKNEVFLCGRTSIELIP